MMRREIDFLLYDWLDIERLVDLAAFGDQERTDWDAFLNLSEDISENEFLSCYKATDREEPYLDNGQVRVQKDLKAALATYLKAGLHLSALDVENGGMGLPYTVATAAMAELMASNVAGSGFILLSAANTRVITEFGTPAQIASFATPQIEGSALGTMCLSEPDVGSSLGDITTRAVPDGDDAHGMRYRITGQKMWISAGDHDVTENIIHLVLAKAVQPDGSTIPGPKGTSLFIVPKVLPRSMGQVRNDIAVAGLNHKMGYRGTPNCLLNFGEDGGATGWRIGKEGEGLRIMFQMMNEARIGVGLSGAALAYRGYQLARTYAAERIQGRPIHLPSNSRPITINQHPDIRRMLLLQKVISEGALALCLKSALLCDVAQYAENGVEKKNAAALLDLLTPVIKSWPSEQGLMALHQSIQVHGGYGYTRDFDVEQLYRDSRLNPIHEGTTGIQAIDLLRRKILLDEGRTFKIFLETVRNTIKDATSFPDQAAQLSGLCDHFDSLVRAILETESTEDALSNATGFLEAFGHFVIGWIWLDLAMAGERSGDHQIAEVKKWACRYFFAAELSKIPGLLALLENDNSLTRTVPDTVLI
ncbi:acyl-CoA dehydrogenase [Sedimentitalea sp. CY04]|uniref:Acyl-CoA dehydrogenase n=1 Tax=Parasedimentitalea denitrificans TaxID=2211118 RepID=A0ABX0W9G9_9RHOB|nr:acyl-CoA dehydrogenase [Sedimentitalea sp. CY04]NIZ62304.1 acyl-CoA dehydrogenase [Sedimentitalea sp. CY04]